MSENNESSIKIRDARSDEIAAVAGLILESYKEYEIVMPLGTWAQYASDITDVEGRFPVSELIIAESQGQLVGSVTLFRDLSLLTGATWPDSWAGIRLLAVHPSGRGLGTGRALMDECLRRCRESGISTVGLHTVSFMAVAQRMYENMGFERIAAYDFAPAAGVNVMAYRLDL